MTATSQSVICESAKTTECSGNKEYSDGIAGGGNA